MDSLWEEPSGREAPAPERVERTREQNAELNRRLVAQEEALSRLVVTGEAVEEILGDAAPRDARDGGMRPCAAKQVAGSIRNREAQVTESHLA
ncbi:hypothetical protein ACFVYE_15870 [Streptomyces sp. NPDC058239]|uniref:hypothetical protein n=1 Tax=Streptomyces sp. NPDC058239 TaxID=3346395 RepID=UPI0036EBA252